MEDYDKRRFQLPPHNLMESIDSNIWWFVGLQSIGNVFSYARANEVCHKACMHHHYVSMLLNGPRSLEMGGGVSLS